MNALFNWVDLLKVVSVQFSLGVASKPLATAFSKGNRASLSLETKNREHRILLDLL